MSTVYRATDLQTDNEVAVKVYAPGASLDARARQQREAALGVGLHHDGIVPILDHGVEQTDDSEPGYTYLVSELIDGPTLRDRMAAGPCSAEEVGRLGSRLAAALGYLHDHGIVHRDVKPANVLLRSRDDLSSAMLADFGVAIRIDDTRVTSYGSVVGTAAYLSPEQVNGGELSSATDIYSLGLVLIEALSGVTSYEGSGVECALARLHRQPVIPADAPEWLATLLTAMTARDAADRPSAFDVDVAFGLGQTISDGGTSVLHIAAEEPQPMVFALPGDPTEILPVVAEATPVQKKYWVLGAAALAAFVALIAIIVNSGPPFHALPPSSSPSAPVKAVQVPTPTPTSSHPVIVAQHPTTSARPKPAVPKPPAPVKHHKGHGHGG